MTREEAIRRIEDHMVHHHMGEYPHIFIGDALDMAISALREQDATDTNVGHKWISVEERLPEPYRTVLVRRRHIDAPDCYTTTDHRVSLYGDTTMWSGELKTWKSGVTHWMPLPEPPEVEG